LCGINSFKLKISTLLGEKFLWEEVIPPVFGRIVGLVIPPEGEIPSTL